ncbi:MAG: flagellin/flagellar hook associated protein [Firmicutes bacterium]|nr:flagellin/flagellar hook associated protein [Bacillota bacterium]
MIINHNMASLNTLNSLNANSTTMQKSLAKLSSGLRINSAADDAAGLAISEKMRGQISGLDTASSNAQNGISLLQTAEGALDETTSILQRMRELAVESSSDTITDSDRTDIQSEFSELSDEIDRIASTTQFNTKNLLDGSMSKDAVATANVTENSSFASTTTAGTLVTALNDSSGNSLGITVGDTISLSYVMDGALQTTSFTVAATTTLADLATADFSLTTPTTGTLTATAAVSGTTTAVYGITYTVTDSAGEKNTTASDDLSSFTQTVSSNNNRADGSATILIGANTGQDFNVSIAAMDASSLGVANLTVTSQSAAEVAISVIDTATSMVSAARGKMGAEENRLEHTINNLTTASENTTAAESRIRDVDMAAEMAEYTKLSVINQAATAMLAQSNQLPQQVLSLLK